jgi:hypothetical protein
MKKLIFFAMAIFLLSSVGYAQTHYKRNLLNESTQDQIITSRMNDLAPNHTSGAIHTLFESLLLGQGVKQEMLSNDEPSRLGLFALPLEGFESTTGTEMPLGWTTWQATGSGTWVSSDRVGNSMLMVNLPPYQGNRCAYIRYQSAPGNNAWMFSKGITLTEGITYTIGFAVVAYGDGNFERVQLRIGTSTNANEMAEATQLWANTANINSWQYITVNYTPPATGVYYLGFQDYTPYAQALAAGIDNVSVYSQAENDLVITAGPPYLYTQVPLSQIAVSAKAKNIGTLPQTNVILSATLNGASLGSTTPVASLDPGESTDWLMLQGTGQLGTNTVTCEVSATEEEQDPEDNAVTYTFAGTDNMYAYDNVTTSFNTTTGNNTAITFGNIFQIFNTDTLSQVAIAFGSATSLAYGIGLYQMIGDLVCDNVNLLGTNTFTRNATGWAYLTVPEVILEPGRYFLCVEQRTNTNISVSYVSNPNKVRYVLNANYTLSANGAGIAPAIRMVLKSKSCDPPTNLSVTPTYTSAVFSWNGEAISYLLTIEDGTNTITRITTAKTITVPLAYGVNYTWTVKGFCDATTGGIAEGPAFATPSCVIGFFPYEQGFENNGTALPPCWTQEYVSSTTENWQIVPIATGPVTIPSPPIDLGIYKAYFYNMFSGRQTKLVTAQLDISALNTPVLRFWHIQPDRLSVSDGLRIFYKTSAGGTWTPLAQYLSAIPDWIDKTIELPNKSSDYYIAFEARSEGGGGVHLDNISIIDFDGFIDIDVAEIISPVAGINEDLTDAEPVIVRLKNNGNAPITGFTLDLTINETLVATETFTGVIASGASYNYTFTATADLSAAGTHTVTVTATAAGDDDPENDSRTVTVINVICSTLTEFEEGFEFDSEEVIIDAIPPCWKQEQVTGSMQWDVVRSLVGIPNTVHPNSTGVYKARFYSPSSSTQITKLVSPALDLTDMVDPRIKFWHTQAAWESDQDELRIYYKTSANGAWNLIEQFTYNIPDWTESVVALPNKSNDYYIAFEGVGHWGWGILLDDISLFDFDTFVDAELEQIIYPYEGTHVNLTNSEKVKCVIKNNGNRSLTDFTISAQCNGVTYTEPFIGSIPSLSSAEFEFNAGLNLSAAGNYTIKVTVNVEDDEVEWNNSQIVTLTNIVCSQITALPMHEDFYGGIPICWRNIDNTGDGLTWYPMALGSEQFVVSYSYANNYGPVLADNWLITPQIVLPATGIYALSFKVGALDPYYPLEKYSVLISTTGAALNDFIPIHTERLITGDWKRVILSLEEFSGQNIYIAFRHWDSYDQFAIKLDDVEVLDLTNYIDVEVARIVHPEPANINLTNNEKVQIELKNNGGAPISNIELTLALNGSDVATETFTDSIPVLGSATFEFNAGLNLAAAGNYTIKVTAEYPEDMYLANNTKTVTITNTICPSITSFPWLENFAGGIPECWRNIDADGDGRLWEWGTVDGSNMLAASFSYINFFGPITPDNWLITPKIELPADGIYKLSYKIGAADPAYFAEHYSVLVSTTGTHLNDFESIHSETLTAGAMKTVTLNLTEYVGEDIYIAFRHHNSTDQFAIVLDDIEVSYLASLYTVTFIVKDEENETLIEDATIVFDGVTLSGYTAIKPNGTYPYTVTKTGYQTATGQVVVNGADVTQEIWLIPETTPVYTVTFVVMDMQGANIPDAQIEFDGETLLGYVAENIPAGEYSWAVSKTGYITKNGTVIVVDRDVEVPVSLASLSIGTNSLSEIVLSPNPFTNEINISNPEIVKSIQIVSTTGQKVKDVIFNGNSILTGELASGIYFVTIKGFSGEKGVYKMVKR